ncbi:MAG TPA: signal peptidase I [Propionicimonas sp.]|nr:signal peptidase I [Propionicimonas sp.]HQA77079.1 signal peptidase I [Propionicimonas sp.]HQD97018.1 signal peptidase I [Propionicimonas sp.]
MSAPTSAGNGRKAWSVIGSWLREIAIVVVGALVASTLLRLFVVQMFVIPSGSMENTLLEHDRVAVQKIVGFERGDIVVFRDTQNWLIPVPVKDDPVVKTLVFLGLAPDESTGHLIKRVIGVAGDHVACCDARGRVTVNGVALNETEYLYTDPATGKQVDPSSVAFDVVVPAGRVFMMGDHRNDSQDSRCHLDEQLDSDPAGSAAFIPVENIVGTGVAVVYPFARMHTISRPLTFESIPAGQDPPTEAVITGPKVLC